MSVYKVAQDVEADDKLIGPFSFRQFIYLIIVAIGVGLAWALFQVAPPLVIIPLPIILFFGALALPLKKDQPMEVYLAAVVSFHLKPKKRLWVPDGVQSLVEIYAPKVIEKQYAKDLSSHEAEKRFAYLASIMDTQGWAVRDPSLLNAQFTGHDTAMQNDVYNEAQQTEDFLDETGGVALAFEDRMVQADNKRRQEIINRMHNSTGSQQLATTPQPASQPVQQPQPQPAAPQYQAPIEVSPSLDNLQSPIPEPLPAPEEIKFDPYPSSMHQSVIQPSSQDDRVEQSITEPEESVSEIRTTPDIINLANNSDLSIETIAHEAQRIKNKKLSDGEEVIISLH